MTEEETRKDKLLESHLNAEQLEQIINDYIDQNHISYKDAIFMLEKIKFAYLLDLTNEDEAVNNITDRVNQISHKIPMSVNEVGRLD